MRVRFFGGWEFRGRRRASAATWRSVGYTKGVPMGADLPAGEASPSFLVYALRDPMGANLDRVQIVKGWLDADGEPAGDRSMTSPGRTNAAGRDGKLPPVGDTVDLSVPSWTNTIGASELGAVWTDPDFDPARARLLLRPRDRDPDAALDGL